MKRQELLVAALENGTVIDHIPSNKLFEVVNLLHLEQMKTSITVGYNLKSKKMGHKSIIKIAGKFFSDEEMAALREEMGVELGDLVMFAVADRKGADEILGGMRLHMAGALGVPREGHDFLWVVNFPLFHWDDDAKRYEAEHQPFTQPHLDELDLLETDPLAMGSCTYDFVMDGFEAGGGGMRIHDAALQLKMLEFMGFTEERARAQFGFLMDALEFGAPPMGGFALGLDRVCMLLAGCDSIRDVMAFPKTSSGSDLMSAAPSEVSMAQLKEVGLRLM